MRPLRWLGRLALAAWVVGGMAAGAALLALHAPHARAPRDAAVDDPRLTQLAIRSPPRWRLVHVVHTDCACSAPLVEHLVLRGRQRDVEERVLLLGASARERRDLERVGFAVEEVSEDLARRQYGVERAPLLILADPAGVVRYVGAYAAPGSGADLRDLDLLARARGARALDALAGDGCAVGARLARWGQPSADRNPKDRS